MRILLLSMPNITPASADSMILPSLGIASLAGNIDPNVQHLKIADLVLRRHDYRQFVHDVVKTERPHLVGLSGLTCSLPTALELAVSIKQQSPQTLIAVGGYLALCHETELMSSPAAPAIDFIIRGEGEITFQELLTELEGDRNFGRLTGLTFRREGQLVTTPDRDLADLADIRRPDRRARLLTHGFHLWGIPADVVETSRGCTFDCAFCCVSQQYARTYRQYSIDRVLSDIERTYANGARFIILADDNITLDLPRLDQLCDALMQARLPGLRFFAQAAVKPIANHPDLVQKMRHAGFEIIFLGLENLLERNLKFLNKKTSNHELARLALQNLRRHHIISTVGLILGNPDDRAADLWENFNQVRTLRPDLPNFMTLTPFPKTKIRQQLLAAGLITNPTDYSRYDLIQANVRTRYLSDTELLHLVKHFFYKYYFSFRFIFYSQMLRRYWRFALTYLLNEIKAHWAKRRAQRAGSKAHRA